MADYQQASLGAVDCVDILVLAGAPRNDNLPRLQTGFDGFPIKASHVIRGTNAEKIAQLWRTLPPTTNPARCHVPPFGLRFYQAETLLLEASLCWQCSNIFIVIADEKAGYIFDPKHKISQELLKLLKKLSKT
jgi:hypothetical protein